MQQIPIYLINLEQSVDRLDHADRQLAAAGLQYQRILAVDGRNTPPHSFSSYCDTATRSYFGRSMTGGEIGCYLSHLTCAQAILDSGVPQAIVLEDDAVLHSQIAKTLPQISAFLNANHPDWEIVNLGRAPHRAMTKRKSIGKHDLFSSPYFPMTTTGLMWSRRGVENWVQEHTKIWAPVDHYFRRRFARRGTGFALSRPCLWPGNFTSDIDDVREISPGADNVPAVTSRQTSQKSLNHFVKEFRRQAVTYSYAYRHHILNRLAG